MTKVRFEVDGKRFEIQGDSQQDLAELLERIRPDRIWMLIEDRWREIKT